MDDGESQIRPSSRSRNSHCQPRARSKRILDLAVPLALLLVTIVHNSESLDTELNEMRREGLEYHDISIYIEEKVEYVHSRIALKPGNWH